MFLSVSWKVADWYCHSVAPQEGSYRNVVQRLRNFCHQATCVFSAHCTSRLSGRYRSPAAVVTEVLWKMVKVVMHHIVLTANGNSRCRREVTLVTMQPVTTSQYILETIMLTRELSNRWSWHCRWTAVDSCVEEHWHFVSVSQYLRLAWLARKSR